MRIAGAAMTPTTYLNDVRFDFGDGAYAYVTDSQPTGALIVVDAAAREVERILIGHGHWIERSAAPHEEMFRRMGDGEVDVLVSVWLPASHGAYLAPFVDDVRKITVLYEPSPNTGSTPPDTSAGPARRHSASAVSSTPSQTGDGWRSRCGNRSGCTIGTGSASFGNRRVCWVARIRPR